MWRYMQMQLLELCPSMPMQPHRVGAVLLHAKQPVLILHQHTKAGFGEVLNVNKLFGMSHLASTHN